MNYSERIFATRCTPQTAHSMGQDGYIVVAVFLAKCLSEAKASMTAFFPPGLIK